MLTTDVITHPLLEARFRFQISILRQFRAAAALKVIVGEMLVERTAAKSFRSSFLERYCHEAEYLPNGLGSTI